MLDSFYLLIRLMVSNVFSKWQEQFIWNIDRQIKIMKMYKSGGKYIMDKKWKIINGVAVAIFIAAVFYWIVNS